jgi:hypothetical protein
MIANEKNQQPSATTPSSGQPVPGSPADLDKRAENDNPRANENIAREEGSSEDPTNEVGSEITDGEDA